MARLVPSTNARKMLFRRVDSGNPTRLRKRSVQIQIGFRSVKALIPMFGDSEI